MKDRRGEKIGWLGGFAGGFLWLVILSVVFFVQARLFEAIVSLAIALAAFIEIAATAPWRHPEVQYWRLMLPIYALLFASVPLLLWSFGSLEKAGLSWWSLSWFLPALTPFWIVGKRTWNDNAA